MSASSTDAIGPYADNPRYWQYKGQPVLLLGGSIDDNLFQIPALEEHLDLLVSVGGNYIRNTMSDRPDQGYEIKAFAKNEAGLYDLTVWNETYWQRFADLLRLTADRKIIVQIEIWDRFDHSTAPWQEAPFNPQNNSNYTAETSGLAAEYPDHPGRNIQPFFYTVPTLNNNQVVLPFQQAFVDRILSFSLQYDHVLYCMDNETSGAPEWGQYWAEYVGAKAKQAGVRVQLTEMWDNWNVTHPTHRPTLDHPQRYSFVDLAQNSHITGQLNWERAQWARQYIATTPRPLNSTKIYGADTSKWVERGINDAHGTHTFWRNIIGGFASSRFHRPESGLGLGPKAQANIKSARLLSTSFDFFSATPDANHTLLSDRQENRAYLSYIPAQQYAVYFTDGGAVSLDLSQAKGAFKLKWLEIDQSHWHETNPVEAGAPILLQTPGPGQWVALLSR